MRLCTHVAKRQKKPGSDHGSDHRSRIGSQSTDWIRLIDTRNFACNAKIKSAWHNGAQTALGGLFFAPKPHVVTFTAVFKEECCVVLPWTKAGERYVSFISQLLFPFFFFFSYHLTCYFSFIVYYLAHAREEANNEVRSRTVLDKTTC